MKTWHNKIGIRLLNLKDSTGTVQGNSDLGKVVFTHDDEGYHIIIVNHTNSDLDDYIVTKKYSEAIDHLEFNLSRYGIEKFRDQKSYDIAISRQTFQINRWAKAVSTDMWQEMNALCWVENDKAIIGDNVPTGSDILAMFITLKSKYGI